MTKRPQTHSRKRREEVFAGARLKPLAAHIRRALFPGLVLGLQVGSAVAGPQGGQVVGGAGSIARPNAATTVINQNSHNLAIDWQKFNVGTHELVQFNQPGRNAQALNRIFDQNPSQIHGRINANGRVLLMNPNGVIFGRTAQVNVNALVAAGMRNIPVEDFMAGKFKLEALDGADGAVVNQGTLEAAAGGEIALVGKTVRNEGVIIASAGRVNLAAGDKVTLDFDGDGLMRFTVDEKVLENAQALDDQIANTGSISADGGDVLIAASAARDVFTNAINNSGIVRAGRIEKSGGTIRLVGMGPTASVLNTGTLDASAGDASSGGGSIDVTGANIRQAGTVRADASAGDGGTVRMQSQGTTLVSDAASVTATSTDGGTGGRVELLGERVGVVDRASIDASGTDGGGEVLIGGDYQGKNPAVANAERTVVGAEATVTADATDNGNGGRVIVWADEATSFQGEISARGGPHGGDGGFVETSGKDYLDVRGRVSAAAPLGDGGQWLLDPRDITILQLGGAGDDSTGGDPAAAPVAGKFDITGVTDTFDSFAAGAQADIDQIVTSLEGGTDVTITTGATGPADGDITVAGAITVTTGVSTLTLNAANDITFNPGADIDGTGATLGVVLEFGQTTGGILDFGAAGITANSLMITGGAGSDTIVGPDAVNTWTSTGNNAGNLMSTAIPGITATFTSVENLSGGDLADNMTIGHDFTAIDGGIGTDNIAINAGTIASVVGGAGNDVFSIAAGVVVGSAIDGGADSDTVIGPNGSNVWTVTGSDSGGLTGGSTFTAIETITGGGMDDTFNINASWGGALNGGAGGDSFTFGGDFTVTGAVDGGADADTIDWTAYSSDRDVSLSALGASDGFDGSETSITGSFTNIDAVFGRTGGNDILRGADLANAWDITGSNIGSVTSGAQTLAFTDVETLNGGTMNDGFTINGGTIQTIDGIGTASGNTVTGGNAANVWLVSGADSGSLPGVITSFSTIGNLVGGSMGDEFQIDPGITFGGSIDGQAGIDELDWTSYGSARSVTLTGSAAEGFAGNEASISGGFTDIDILVGDSSVSGTAGNTLTGYNTATGWTLVGGIDDGTLIAEARTLTFTDFSNLSGNAAVDTFNLNDVSADSSDDLTGNALGAGGDDVFNLDGAATIGGTIQGGTTGETGGDQVVGPNLANIWNLTGDKAGNFVVAADNVAFTDIERLQGGSSTDSFDVGASSANLFVDGAGGSDTLDWADFGGAVAATATSVGADGYSGSSATGLSGFADIDVMLADTTAFGALTVDVAAGGTFAVNGLAVANSYQDAGTTATLSVTDFRSLTGSASMADGFVFAAAAFDTAFVLDGGGAGAALGTIDLSADAMGRTYAFTDATSGDVGGMMFSNIGNLSAGAGTDIADYSAVVAAVTIDLSGTSLQGVERVIGDGTNDTLIGNNANNTWSIGAGLGDGIDDGNVNDGTDTVEFVDVSNLTGGTLNDDFNYSDAARITGTIDGTAGGTDVLDFTAQTANVTVDLEAADVVSDAPATLLFAFTDIETVEGGGAGDTLVGANGAGLIFDVTNTDDGTFDAAGANVAFTDFGNLTAGSGGQTIAFGASGSLSGTVTGGAGNDTLDYSSVGATVVTVNLQTSTANLITGGFSSIEGATGDGDDLLIGANTANTFNLTGGDGADDGNINGTFTFTDFSDLQAGSGGDTFAFNGANTLSGDITGGAGSDTLDYSAATGGPLTFTVGSTMYPRVNDTTSIEIVSGTGDTNDVLNGTGAADTFAVGNVGGTNEVNIGAVSYRNIEDINGLAGSDVFDITGDHLGDLSGGSDADTFNFGLAGEAPVVTGQVDGGVGPGDVMDFNNYGAAVTATITGGNRGNVNATPDPIVFGGDDYNQIEEVKGTGVQAADGSSHDWLITGLNEVTLDVTNMFTDVAFIVGGNMTDNFTVEIDGRLTGSIDGGTGSDFLIADAATSADAIFDVNAPDAGTITVDNAGAMLSTAFSNIENLTGSNVDDVFNFTATGSISEVVDGGGSAAEDLVDFSATGLASFTATVDGAAFGIANIDRIVGNNASGLVLGGGVTFTVTGPNDGTVDGGATLGITFEDWASLAGTAGIDTFDFNGGDVSGTIDGLGGADVADFEDHDVNIAVTLGGTGTTDGFQGTTLTDTGGFDNIDEIKARIAPGTDSLTGLDATAMWSVSGAPQYTSTNTLSFSNFEALTGGSQADSFALGDGVDVATIDGGADPTPGVDTLDLALYTSALTWTINADGGGTVNTLSTMAFSDIEAFVGGTLADAFNVTTDSGMLNLFGADPGNVDGGGGANTISFAGRTTAVTVELDNVANITTISGGGSASDLLTGTSLADTFATAPGVDSGGVTGGITVGYSAFENLAGGGGADVFDIDHNVTGSVSGGAGNDIFNLDTAGVTVSGGILGGANDDTVNVRASVASAVDGEGGNDIVNVDPTGAGGIVLTGNVSGGANDDTFNIGMPTGAPPGASNSRIAGQVDGGSGSDTLDYTGTNHGMLADVTGSGVDGDNIEFTGATTVVDNIAGDDVVNINTVIDNRLGTLLGPNENTTWMITGMNSGTFQADSAPAATAFTNFQIVGRGFADRFIFEDAGQIVGLAGSPGVVGGGGTDSIEYASGEAAPAAIDFTLKDITLTASAFDEGTVTTGIGDTQFDLIEAIIGNDVGTTVLVQTNWAGSVDGGSGGSEVRFNVGTGQNVTLTAEGTNVGFKGTTATITDSAGTIAGGNFDNVTALTNLDAGATSLTGANLANTWTLLDGDGAPATSDNDGTIATATPRSLTFTDFDNLIGGTAADIFNVSDEHTGNLTGNGGDDQFVFNGTAADRLSGLITGGAGADTLDYSSFGGVVTVNIDGPGTPDGFTGRETGVFSLTGTFDGIDQILAENGGGDTLVAPNAINSWVITGTNVFTLDSGGSGPVGFTDFANLTGGTLADTFTFTTGDITGNLDGGIGNDTLSYAGNAAPASVVLTALGTSDGFFGSAGSASFIGGTFNNVNSLIGGAAGSDSLTGLNAASTWTLDGTSYGAGGRSLTFAASGANAVENLIGGSANDVFDFNGPGSILGTVDGGLGADTLNWEDTDNAVAFQLLGMGSLDGSRGDAVGIIAATVPGFDNIETFISDAADSTFLGLDEATTWTINGLNSFQIMSASLGSLQFDNFAQSLQGGSATDTFLILSDPGDGLGNGPASLTGGIDGGAGANTLSADNVNNLWTITGPASGTVTGLGTAFTNIGGVTGGTLNDLFTVVGASTFTGTINGAAGTNQIVGGNVANGWNLTGANQGNIDGNSSFTNISRLVGGAATDTFNFSNASTFASLDAAGGSDILNYAAVTGPITVNLATNTVNLIGAGQATNFEQVAGSGNSDTLIGANTANTWTISADDAGSVNGFQFSSVENLVGGSATDQFGFSSAADQISGGIDGSGGDDTVATNFAGANWVVNAANAGTTDGGSFTGIENLSSSTGTANLDLQGASLSGTFRAPKVAFNDTSNSTGGGALNVIGDLENNLANQTLTTAGGAVSVAANATAGTGVLRSTGSGTFLIDTDGGAVSAPGGLFATTGTVTIDTSSGAPGGDVLLGTVGAAGGAATFNFITATGDIQAGTITGALLAVTSAGGSFASGAVSTSGPTTINTGGGSVTTGTIGASALTLDSGGAALGSVTTTGAQTYTGPVAISGSLSGGIVTFNSGGGDFTTTGAVNATSLNGSTAGGDYASGAIVTSTSGTTSVATGGGDFSSGTLTTVGPTTINAGGGRAAISGAVDVGANAFSANAGAGLNVGGAIDAASVSISSGAASVARVTTSGAQTYTGAVTFRGSSNSAIPTVYNASSFSFGGLNVSNNVILQAASNVFAFGGAVTGTGNLDIIPTAITDIFIGNGSGAGHIAADKFTGFQGHLIIGAQLNPLDSPAQEAVVVNPPGVTADLITVEQEFLVGGDVTLIGSNIVLDAGVSGAAGTGQVTLVAVGDTQGNGGATPGDITGPLAGTAIIGGGTAVLIANNAVVNAGTIRLELSGGDLFLAQSADQAEPVFDPSSNAISQDFDPSTVPLIASLGLNLQSVQVVFTNPAAALTGLQNVQFIDVGLFEEELSLFGVIGNGIAMSLDQCEEPEGCAPNLSEEEIEALIVQIELRIAEIERRLDSGKIDAEDGQRLLAGFRQELENFQSYRRQLQDYAESADDFGDDFGELDDFAEEFDDALPAAEPDAGGPAAEELGAPQFAEPEPQPEPEPTEEAFEELEDEFVEEEIPADEFEDLDEGLEEQIPELGPDPDAAPEFEDLDEELDEFEELGERIDEALMRLAQNAYVSQYQGAVGVATDGRVVWTGDIVLPSNAARF